MSHVALWSHSQQVFHVEEVGEMIANNLNAYARRKPVDFVPLLIASEPECRDLVSRLMHRTKLSSTFDDIGA